MDDSLTMVYTALAEDATHIFATRYYKSGRWDNEKASISLENCWKTSKQIQFNSVTKPTNIY